MSKAYRKILEADFWLRLLAHFLLWANRTYKACKSYLSNMTYKFYASYFLPWFKKNSFNLKISLLVLAGVGALTAVAGGLIWLKTWSLSDSSLDGNASFGATAGQLAEVDINSPADYDEPLIIKLANQVFSIAPLGARAAAASAESNTVKYIDAFANTDIVQTRFANKIKEDIILKQPGHPAIFEYQIDLAKYDFAKDNEGNLVFYQKGHKGDSAWWRFAIPAPFMIDASGKQSSTDDVSMELKNNGRLSIKPSAWWLGSAKYPVNLDPTIEISILNLHSHPQQGQNWAVDFTTIGSADLQIIPNDQATVDDDEFVSLTCNGETRTPQILAGDVIYYPNWSCAGIGQVVHSTKKAGNHILRFEFGGQVSYAYNSSSNPSVLFRAGIAPSAGPDTTTYIEDVFSTYTYTGNGSTQTITTGIDADLIWLKHRNDADGHGLFDTIRGATYELYSNGTSASYQTSNSLTAFSSTGFSLGSYGNYNYNTGTYVSWSFAQANKFFKVAQVTKSASSDATVDLSSLTTVGMVAVKRTDSTGDWYVWHRSLTAGKLLYLNSVEEEATLGHITVSGTTLTLEDGVIADGTYIVYAWAHDTASTGLIQCGSYVGTGAVKHDVTLGWEPQLIITKRAISVSNGYWYIGDITRGMTSDGTVARLFPSHSLAESSQTTTYGPNATGFTIQANTDGDFNADGDTYIYCAIRRGPMKQATSGTQVYNAIARTGTGAAATVTGVGFPPDMSLTKDRGSASYEPYGFDRLRGANLALRYAATTAELTRTDVLSSFNMDGVTLGADTPGGVNQNTNTYINWFFRRYPGVFDVVAYAGDGVAGRTVAHNLGVVPEMMIVKSRNNTNSWPVYHSITGNTSAMSLDEAWTLATSDSYWNNTSPTSAVFSVGTNSKMNAVNYTYAAYLFATKAGISKVGSYTGNGSSQTINAGFLSGARFILIHPVNDIGDWYVWDSTRGIVAGNDPHLSLNTTSAEVTDDDSIDPDNSGFIVNQVAATNVNVTDATYIYLAFSGDTPSTETPRTPTVPIVFRTTPAVAEVAAVGQQAYTTAGTYSWTAPAGVTSVSVVCVGGGGSGRQVIWYVEDTEQSAGRGGSGGALAYANNITVVPGNSYTVIVGSGGVDSSFNSTSCKAGAGQMAPGGATYTPPPGGTVLYGSGGAGGAGGGGAGNNGSSGAGGAGGYSGSGGAGANYGQTPATSGTGGGGGGGAFGASKAGAGGGGVGILGEGSSGAGGTTSGGIGTGGRGGSGGANGADSNQGSTAGLYGAGGGTTDTDSVLGAGGACRIIWPGDVRQFPSTRTADETPTGYSAPIAAINKPVIFRSPPVAPVNTVAPAVTGTATVGQTLSCSTGTWTGKPTPTYTYQWQHTTTNIGSATNSTYVLDSTYIGETIRCVVTATNSGGAVSANSNNTSAVQLSAPSTVEYLVVAGGGGGGRNSTTDGGIGAGGGGAGGLKTATGYAVSVGSPITVTVGDGGAGATSDGTDGTDGSNSVWGTITVLGGGGGGGANAASGRSGGSGGGGSNMSNNAGAGAGTAGQGYKGGGSDDSNYAAGGGGGGSSHAGYTSWSNNGGNGGEGLSSSISGASVGYAGGGGGGGAITSGGNTAGAGGGSYGGGIGQYRSGAGSAGTANTGGGGGGGSQGNGRNGGSGVVIIRYSDSYAAAASTTGSPDYTVSGGYRIYKWTTVGSGSITF